MFFSYARLCLCIRSKLAALVVVGGLALPFSVLSQEQTVYELSPFEVTPTEEGAYDILDTVSLMGTRTELSRLPITAEIIGGQLLEDIGVEDNTEHPEERGNISLRAVGAA